MNSLVEIGFKQEPIAFFRPVVNVHTQALWLTDRQSDRVLFESRLQSVSADVLSDSWQLICFEPPTKEITRGKYHQWRGFKEMN